MYGHTELTVSVADCQQENFYLSQVKISKEMEKSPLALAIRHVKLRGNNGPKRQFPEPPRPVSTVYFIKVLDISNNW